MEHMEEMITAMKEAVKSTIKEQIAYGWSLDQVEGMFIVAARRALDELKEEH